MSIETPSVLDGGWRRLDSPYQSRGMTWDTWQLNDGDLYLGIPRPFIAAIRAEAIREAVALVDSLLGVIEAEYGNDPDDQHVRPITTLARAFLSRFPATPEGSEG